MKCTGGTARESPHNLSIKKAHARARIFEVEQIEYTLFEGTLLLAEATLANVGTAALGCSLVAVGRVLNSCTPREFKLASKLAQRAGAVVPT